MLLHSLFTHRFNKSRSNRASRRINPFENLETRLLHSVGGGFIGSGIHGDYYQGINLDNNGTVTAAFSRNDVRIDFDWSNYKSPGGSSSSGQSLIGTDNYSVRWTGQIVARYGETYTFKTTTDDGVRLYIKPAGSSTWTTVINNWGGNSTTVNTGSFKMAAGQKYDIKMEFYESTGSAVAKLKWSSASTPEEVIEPAVQIGVNASSAVDYEPGTIFADMMKMARMDSFKAVTPGAILDANGWPTGDSEFILFHGLNYDMRGTYTMTFNGRADVSLGWAGTTVLSKTYDATTNVTTLKFNYKDVDGVDLRNSQLIAKFTNTRRLATDTTATGITNIKIMRPIAPGSTTSYAPTDIFTNQYKALISKFTVIRNMDYLASNTNANSVQEWADRLKPGYSSQQGTLGTYQGTGGSIEYAVALANETGKDLWLNLPVQASDDYITKLAYALRFGTDADGNPYTSPQANPVYAGVEPNLKIYLELSNEVWNGIFPQAQLAKTIAQREVANNTETGKALNYDNVNNADVWARRWWALRTAQISAIFRNVWGDSSMMETVRPVFQFQYGNLNNTAVDTLQFLDNYLNNANGDHVANPHPVNYYLYAAGGAWYSSASDPSGLGTFTFADPSFESTRIPTGTYQQSPSTTGWSFSGTSGLVSNGASSTLNGVTITPPSATSGNQAAYIAGTGSISQKVTLPAGVMDITFQIAQGNTGSEAVSVYIDGTLVTSNMTPGKTTYGFYRAGVLNVAAGEHTITIKGSGNGIVYLDDLKIETVESIFQNSTISNVTNTARTEVNWSLAYGLKAVGYEGGFSIGGDQPNSVARAANVDPRVQQYTYDTVMQYYAAGGSLPVAFDASFGGYAVAASTPYGYASIENLVTPKLLGYEQAMNALAPNLTNATPVPNVLDASNVSLWLGNFEGKTRSDQGGNIYQKGGWVSWNINVPANGSYVLNTSSTGTGGKFVVLVDEQVVATGDSGKDIAGTITLSPGMHSVKIRSTGDAQFRITKVSVTQAAAPAAPTLTSADLTSGQAHVAWTNVPGATGYKVMYGTAPGSYTSTLDAGNTTSATISGLSSNGVYYVVVCAYDANGLLSLLSNQIRIAAPASGAEFKLDFENQTAGTTKTNWTFGDYTIHGLGNGNNLQIQDSGTLQWPGSWPSTVLFAQNWSNGQGIERTDHAAFNMNSIDLYGLGLGTSAVITGYDASGTSFKQIVNFATTGSDRVSAKITLDWLQVTKVEVRWYEKADGGGGARFGAIDNILINQNGVDPGPSPTPDPVPVPVDPAVSSYTVDAKHAFSFVDANGDTVTVKLSGPGTALVYRQDGKQMDASSIVLSNTTKTSSLSITVTGAKASPKTTTIGAIRFGSAQLKSLSAATVDLTGAGIVGETGSYATAISLRDLLNGADIVLPGTTPNTTVSLTARHVGDGSNIQIAMPIASLVFADFGNGVIQTPTLSTLKTTGISGSLAGDFGGSITLSNTAGIKSNILGAVSIAGNILGGTWTVAGTAGTISARSIAGAWKGLFDGRISRISTQLDMSGSLSALGLSTWLVGGNLSQMTATFGASSTAGTEVLTGLAVSGTLLNSTITTIGGIGTIAAKLMHGNTIFAGVAGTSVPTSSSGFSSNETIRSIRVTGDSKNKSAVVSDNQIAARSIRSMTAYYPDEAGTSKVVSGSLSALSVVQIVAGKTKVTTFRNLTTLSPAVSIPGFDVDLI